MFARFLITFLLGISPIVALAEEQQLPLRGDVEQNTFFDKFSEMMTVLEGANSPIIDTFVSTALSEKNSHNQTYDKKFYQGLNSVYNNKFVEAGDVFTSLFQLAHHDGYRNLTNYSYVLIDVAKA